MTAPKKQRKKKILPQQTYSARRNADRARRAHRRARTARRQQERRQFKFRVRVVRRYTQLRRQGVAEQRAVELTSRRRWAARGGAGWGQRRRLAGLRAGIVQKYGLEKGVSVPFLYLVLIVLGVV